jgi:hypothetical protein
MDCNWYIQLIIRNETVRALLDNEIDFWRLLAWAHSIGRLQYIQHDFIIFFLNIVNPATSPQRQRHHQLIFRKFGNIRISRWQKAVSTV